MQLYQVAGYKININLTSFLYTSNGQLEFEGRNTVSCTLAPTKIKCFITNLAKNGQDLSEENKILMIEPNNLVK